MPVALVLVHSPLTGPTTWENLAEIVRKRGHKIAIPDLTGAIFNGPPYWSRQVDAIVAASQSGILVGHSGAGPLLATAGAALESVEGYVFVDARLPHPGQSWMQTVPAELITQLRTMADGGWLPPWSQWWGADGLTSFVPDPGMRARFVAGCPRLPIAMFEEVQPPAPGWPNAPCAYLRLSGAYQDAANQARTLGWPVTELASHHLAVLTDAELVVDPLLDLVGRLQR